ncbi:hypothetical protein ACVW0Y_002791 [Pseudomonas sp. TE3786]
MAPVLAFAAALPAQAETFESGEIEERFDSTWSIGASWGTSDAKKKFIGVGNGGT